MVPSLAELPLAKACPSCNAQEGRACTVPTETSRRSVEWFHAAREYPF